MVKNLCKVLSVSWIESFLKGKKGYIYEPRIGNRLFSKIIYFLEEVVKFTPPFSHRSTTMRMLTPGNS